MARGPQPVAGARRRRDGARPRRFTPGGSPASRRRPAAPAPGRALGSATRFRWATSTAIRHVHGDGAGLECLPALQEVPPADRDHEHQAGGDEEEHQDERLRRRGSTHCAGSGAR
jgi:hypothetical protein